MRSFLSGLVAIAFVVMAFSTTAAQNKYVGVKQCKMCHQTPKQGQQFDIWSKSKHAGAFKTLASAKAAEIAKAKGIKGSPAEAKECLECHTLGKTVEATMLDKSFVMDDGVQCETCHGPGSAYKMMSTMKDAAKAKAAGLAMYKDDAAIEALCVTCHNDKSPTKKAFDLKKMWAEIKHTVPKG